MDSSMAYTTTHFTVTIVDEVFADDPRDALALTLTRIRDEETVASVECHTTNTIHHFEFDMDGDLVPIRVDILDPQD